MLPRNGISSRGGAVTPEVLGCALVEERGGLLNSLAYIAEFKEYL